MTAAAGTAPRAEAPVERVSARAYTVPTDAPEADGTYRWDKTTLVLAEVEAAGQTGIGHTYADACIAGLVRGTLAHAVHGVCALDVPTAWRAMHVAVRNMGRDGLAACAISAVDAALWDLKGKLLGRAVAALLGRARETVPIYGSGGFTTYTDEQTVRQLSGWVGRDGCRWVKMKIGTDPGRDPARVAAARAAIGGAGLFVDANGAYTAKQAIALARDFAREGVLWFEEPVTSDDPAGLRDVRRHVRAPMDVAAGEYTYDLDYVRRMLQAEAVDVMQADASRCGGITGFMRAAAVCEAHHVDLSGHCAPALHVHPACAAPGLRHLEWFHDHVRIEHMLFDGAPEPRDGTIQPRPRPARPGARTQAGGRGEIRSVRDDMGHNATAASSAAPPPLPGRVRPPVARATPRRTGGRAARAARRAGA